MSATTEFPFRQSLATLDSTLDHLVASGDLTDRQAHLVHDAYAAEGLAEAPPAAGPAPGHPSTWAGRLIEVGAYLGAALVAAGGALVIGQQWEEMGRAGQLALLVGLAVLFAVAGAVAAAVSRGRRGVEHEYATTRRLASTLLTLSAAASAGVVVRVFVPDTGDLPEVRAGWMILTAAAVAGAVLVAARIVAPSALAELGLYAAVVAAAFGAMLVVSLPEGPTLPRVLFFCLGVGYAALALTTRMLTVPTLGLVLGLATALVASVGGTTDSRVLLAVLALGCFAAYLVRPRWPLVTAAMLAAVALTFSVVGDAFGPAVAMLVSGVLLLLLTAGALVLRQRWARTRTVAPGSPGTGVSG